MTHCLCLLASPQLTQQTLPANEIYTMHIPLYWAEGRAQSRTRGKQVTARRFGWSDSSQSEAQAHADERAQGALQAILAGEQLKRREAKVAYNGFDGLPIREEILQRDQETVLTRNAYGAHCLNTPNVLFADVDFTDTTPLLYSILIYILLVGGWFYSFINLGYHWLWALVLAIPVVAHYFALLCKFLFSLIYGKDEDLLRYRIIKFLKQHPEWNFHLYQTPAGMRIVATHRTFDPLEPSVQNCFRKLRVDPIYELMCEKQQCFRARVTGKPWRMGIKEHMRPQPGIWPVHPDRMELRNAWIERYETRAKDFAACRYIDSLGSGVIDPYVRNVIELHDELSRARSSLPIA